MLGGSRRNGPLHIQAAQRLGLHPITLAMDPTRYDYLAAKTVEAIRIDTGNLDALIHECSRLHVTYDIAGITGFAGLDESISATVGKLCRHFGLPGPNPASVERCCDKFAQRQVLADAGVPMPTYHLAANATEVESFAAEIGLPVVVKPAIGCGSIGVRLCRNVDELAEHTSYLLGGKHTGRSSPRILVEEFAQGPVYVANLMGNEVIGITAYEFGPPPYFVVHECVTPAPLTDEEHQRIADVSLSCLRALGLGWGPSNIEFRWTKRGPVVIEVNPRLGDGEPEMIQQAYGVDLVTEHIKVVIGEEWDLRKRHSQTVGFRNLVPDQDGILDWNDVESQAAAVPGVVDVKFNIASKTPIVRKGDCRDSMGYVIAVSPSLGQSKAILQRAVDSIGWSIKPFPRLGK
ncbi:MAG: ATP-grasp domain-containing protein [Mesorhizobium sp.]|nr:ATP-grasp domain-containing protein [Mesorhizobium sp. M1A.F.Ca.IN.022.06.1.1]RWG44386.1 MAG: ATP-grasp domain-containing protein [Mesorhizobium sp.]